jgi:hypothetical protein
VFSAVHFLSSLAAKRYFVLPMQHSFGPLDRSAINPFSGCNLLNSGALISPRPPLGDWACAGRSSNSLRRGLVIRFLTGLAYLLHTASCSQWKKCVVDIDPVPHVRWNCRVRWLTLILVEHEPSLSSSSPLTTRIPPPWRDSDKHSPSSFFRSLSTH